MFRSPQLLALPSLKGTQRSLLLLSKEALPSICPRHLRSGPDGRRALSLGFVEKSCCSKKEEDIQDKLPQDIAKEQKIIRKTQANQGSPDNSPPAPDELTKIAPCSQHLKLSINRLFSCSVHPLSSTWLALPSHNHSQTNLLEYLINAETSGRSDHKCLLLHSHNQAGKQKVGATTSCNIESEQHSHSSVSFLRGSHKLLFPRSLLSTPNLWTRSSIVAGRLWEQHLAIQACGMHGATQLKVTPEYCLSAENEDRCRKRLQSNAALYQKEKGKSWAAVLVCLCTERGEPAFLFTLRSSKLKGRHKGDVSFAGGKKDPADTDVVDTALREAHEELGVTVRADQVWGVLKPLRDMSGMLIAPVLANLGPLEALSFRPNPSEVEEIFTLSLAHVCNPRNRGYTNFRTGDRYGYTLPVFCNGKHRVWGLTAVALEHTLKLIVPP
ncbi:mitochondrial coenzyme A diphosphatase NUDT8 [Alosa pseudoharengus]|uniref:mitochondrial coenzyme A diphosphatase NUDT8 n=1 Tax=Alosa pseudoharengus TaxID=34774 RepID=UPI003F8904AA